MSLQPETVGSLFEMSREPVLGIDADQTIAFANPAAVSLLGVHAGDRAEDVLEKHILMETAEQFIASLRIGDRWANVSVRRIEDIMVCTCLFLQQHPPYPAQDKSVKEISDALMSARLAIDALVRRTKAEDDDALQETVQTLYLEYYRMQRACRHMNIASNILHDSLPMMSGVTDLGVLCRELCDTVGRLFEARGISVLFGMDPGLHLTIADSDLLEQMLANLLVNSLAHCETGDSVRVKLSRQGDRFVIAVEDSGSGISPEQMSRIFNNEPAPDGAGQGLLIVRGIAESHGGSVILESRPGLGTSVRVSIPYKQTGSLQMNSPVVRYRSDGMNTVLTEFSVLLDKKYYTRRMFD